MKAVAGKLAKEDVDTFKAGANVFAKKIVANFKDYEFVGRAYLLYLLTLTIKCQYTGESMNPDGLVALLNYRVSQNLTGIEYVLIAHFSSRRMGLLVRVI